MKNILIIDDSLTVNEDLRQLFEENGYQVTTCPTLAEAKSQLKSQSFDLILLDVLLPDGDGIAFLKVIKKSEQTNSIPVMILSTEAEVKDRIAGMSLGAVDYIGKPYDRSFVIQRANSLLGNESELESTTHQPSILVIDDSATTREMLGKMLSDAGFKVHFATTGEEGVKLASQLLPDALIVDGKLPGIDGPTVVSRIRSDGRLGNTPCVILTDSEVKGDEFAALEAGSDSYIRKSEDAEVFLAKIKALLRGASGSRASAPKKSFLSPKRVLAIDDSETYLAAVTDSLREDAYDVITAKRGLDGINILSAQSVDCVLLDLSMPDLSGQETCFRIKNSDKARTVPIIMLTAREDREAMLDSFNAGADDYIPKSSDFVVLKARVRAQLRRRQFEEENFQIREELTRQEFVALEAKANRDLAEQRGTLLEKLETAYSELDSFSYAVSHDLRAPLRRIQGFCEILNQDFKDKVPSEAQQYLDRISIQTKAMSELIDSLIQLSKLTRTEIKMERINFSEMVQNFVNELTENKEKKVEFVVEPGLWVEADRGLLKVLILNLVGNAWKYSSKNPKPKIEVGKTKNQDKMAIFVKDNGVGFDMIYVKKLFAPFQRLVTTAEFEGSGIGLATVRRVLTRLGGDIWAESAKGKGATFYFTLKGLDQVRRDN